MVDLPRQGTPMPRLIALNSCAGAQASLSDLFSGTAAALVRGFYTAIARGRGIDEDLPSGKVAILGTSDHTREWLTPVLCLRGRNTNLFSVQ
jgi:hypothetical protein